MCKLQLSTPCLFTWMYKMEKKKRRFLQWNIRDQLRFLKCGKSLKNNYQLHADIMISYSTSFNRSSLSKSLSLQNSLTSFISRIWKWKCICFRSNHLYIYNAGIECTRICSYSKFIEKMFGLNTGKAWSRNQRTQIKMVSSSNIISRWS